MDAQQTLEKYIELLGSLPNDMIRNLSLMRELDQKCCTLDRNMEDYSEEKIQLSLKCFGQVDVLIHQLDKDIEQLKQQIAEQEQESQNKLYKSVQTILKRSHTTGAGITGQLQIEHLTQSMMQQVLEPTTTQLSSQQSSSTTAQQQEWTPQQLKKRKSTKRTKQELETNPIVQEEFSSTTTTTDTTIPSTNTTVSANTSDEYCFCGGTAIDGNMVACDNTNCKREWFHFSCVGLTEAPVDSWYCPECAVKLVNTKKRKV